MKKIIVLLSIVAFVFAMASCGGPAADGKKFAKLMCEMEQIQEKMMEADEVEMEKLEAEMEKLYDRMEKLVKELEKKYDDDDKDAEEKFTKAFEDYEC